MTDLDMIPVNSSNIRSIGYLSGTLHVHFTNNSTYTYHGVPEHIFTQFRQSESKMKFLNAAIKGKFEHRKLA